MHHVVMCLVVMYHVIMYHVVMYHVVMYHVVYYTNISTYLFYLNPGRVSLKIGDSNTYLFESVFYVPYHFFTGLINAVVVGMHWFT